MLNLKSVNERCREDKIITIVLSIVLIGVLLFCMTLIFKSLKVEERDVVLVKDMFSEEKRIISDKTDISKVTEEQVTLKVEQPEGILNPEEVISPEGKEDVDVVVPTVSPEIDNKDIENEDEPVVINPLERYEPNEVINVIRLDVYSNISSNDTQE